MVTDVLIPAVVFFGLYHMMKLIADYLLKRKVIKAGHIDKAGILEPPKQSEEINRYPSLKWGLVAPENPQKQLTCCFTISANTNGITLFGFSDVNRA